MFNLHYFRQLEIFNWLKVNFSKSHVLIKLNQFFDSTIFWLEIKSMKHFSRQSQVWARCGSLHQQSHPTLLAHSHKEEVSN